MCECECATNAKRAQHFWGLLRDTLEAPTRKRLRAGTPRVEAREPTPEAASIESLISEIRLMREEQARREELHAAELLQRDQELQRYNS